MADKGEKPTTPWYRPRDSQLQPEKSPTPWYRPSSETRSTEESASRSPWYRSSGKGKRNQVGEARRGKLVEEWMPRQSGRLPVSG